MRVPDDYPDLAFPHRLAFIDLRLSELGLVRSGNSPGRWSKDIADIDAQLCAEAVQRREIDVLKSLSSTD